jgi:hypothetical protein
MRNSEINDEKVEETDNAFMEGQMKDPEFKEMMECMMNNMKEEPLTDNDSEDTSLVCD